MIAAGIPNELKERIRAYYQATTESSYLANWGGAALALHLGLDGERFATLAESLDHTNRVLADHAAIGMDTDVLDAGCGVGGSSLWLARERGARVVGVTIAENQVELARRFAAERGLANRVSFQCADFTATDFTAGSFDVVWNLESLSHVPDVAIYLKHVTRLLRPGGRFAAADVFRGDQGNPEHLQMMCRGCVLPALLPLAEVAARLRDAGFIDVAAVDLTARVFHSATVMQAMAIRRLTILRAQRLLLGREFPLYEAHTRGALGAARGLLSGAVTYGYLVGTRPAR